MCLHDQRQMISLPIYLQEPPASAMQQCLILDFLHVVVMENVFSLTYFLNQLHAERSLQK